MFALPSSDWPWVVLISLLHVLVAGAVTVDVLLKKSDVRGALGWIGAAWFSPFLGGALYYLFGINRVTRRALKMSRLAQPQSSPPASILLKDAPEHICALFETSERVSGKPLTGGNALSILDGGDRAYPQMLEAIAGAKKSVVLASYIFRDDPAGNEFAEALAAARKRGVEVRVLLDSVGIGYFFPRILYRMQAEGVRAARFLHTWLPWRMPFLNMRNHRKIMVTDGALAFVGGMNIGAENSQRLRPADYIDDIHFRVEGPVVRLIMDSFARDWNFTTGETLDEDHWWPDLSPAGPVYARGLSSGPDADIYKLEMILGSALTLAKSRVRILTPYFLPDARLQFAIAQACLRGVQVDIVIPERSDHVVMDWAVRGHLRFFRHMSVNIYTTPQPFDHSKLFTVDGCWCLIGSSNWDARSFRLNFEYDLECYDPVLTEQLDAIIDAKIARGRPMHLAALIARPVLIRLRDSGAGLALPYI